MPRARRLSAIAISFALSLVACGQSCHKSQPSSGEAASLDASPTDARAGPATTFDAASETAKHTVELTALAITSGGSRLHVLADGALAFSHGTTIDRLRRGGARERIARVPFLLDQVADEAPIGTVVGDVERGLFTSVVESHYPSHTNARSFRIRDGRATRILPLDDFYLAASPWHGGRVLALRAKGAVRWEFNSVPFVPSAFEVIAGDPAPVPKLPPKAFVEGFASFASGSVLAAVSLYDDGLIMRRDAILLRWGAKGGEPEVLRPPTGRHAVVEAFAARSESDVVLAGSYREEERGGQWLARFDGREWTVESPPYSGSVDAITIADDGAIWVVSSGMMARARNALWVRDPSADAASPWREVMARPVRGLTFSRPPPRVSLARELRIDRRATMIAAPGTTEKLEDFVPEPVQVVAHDGEVWAIGRLSIDGAAGSVLLRRSAPKAPLVDLADEEARDGAGVSEAPKKDCTSLFVIGGAPSEANVARVRASAAAERSAVFLARVEGRDVLVSQVSSREDGDARATSWRSLGLTADVRCARPAIASIVFDPDARDE